ncbi:MAG: ABC transporter ATP-binding protein [Fimbriiglobus sp.]|jgi:putative ABC transport system ATP-binding protein|nr:ABC transporter ATP-binding protein [Fimbriiglobus sp.]
MAIVEVTDLEKTFNADSPDPVRVLEDLNLEVEEGEFVALMGPSGSGKTTLLNLIAGLDSPTRGTIRVGDQVISGMSESELAKWRTRNVGFVFQFYNLLPVLTAAENVELPLLLLPMTGAERKQRVRNALEIVGLGDRMSHRPGKLSGGQCQRVGIARAIVTDPTIVVCDEPTGALDAKSADNALNLLEQLRADLGKTIIMVTHDPHAAERAQRIVHLEKGRIVPGDERLRLASTRR